MVVSFFFFKKCRGREIIVMKRKGDFSLFKEAFGSTTGALLLMGLKHCKMKAIFVFFFFSLLLEQTG